MSSSWYQSYLQQYFVYTDWDGFFSHRLGDGKYEITGIDTPLQYVEFYKEFEVINGTTSIDFSTLEISEGNVQGTRSGENGNRLWKWRLSMK